MRILSTILQHHILLTIHLNLIMRILSIISMFMFSLLFSVNTFAQLTTIQGTVYNIPTDSTITVHARIFQTTGNYSNNHTTVPDSSGFYSFSTVDIDSILQLPNGAIMVYIMQDCNEAPTHDTIYDIIINSGSVEILDLDYCPSNQTNCSAGYSFNQTDPITQAFVPNQAWIVNESTGSNLTYTWDFGDGTSATGLNNLTHTYTGNGPYILCLSVDDGAGCMDTFCDTLSIDSAGVITKLASGFTIHVVEGNLGAEEIETPTLTVYPNPTNHTLFLNLDIEAFNQAIYMLTDVNGRTLIKEPLKSSTTQIDVSMLPPGSYFIKVQDLNNSLVQKVSIQ